VRTVTVRAFRPCRSVFVSAEVLRQAASSVGAEVFHTAFDKLITRRRQSLQAGLPLSVLNIGADPVGVSVRAVALHAITAELRRGELWCPTADSGPYGPHYWILVRGRVSVETYHEENIIVGFDNSGGRLNQKLTIDKRSHVRKITMLQGPCLLPEGFMHQHGVRVKALQSCEAYRVRKYDLLAAAGTDPLNHWITRFRLLEWDTRNRLRAKFESAHGAVMCQASQTEERSPNSRTHKHEKEKDKDRGSSTPTQSARKELGSKGARSILQGMAPDTAAPDGLKTNGKWRKTADGEQTSFPAEMFGRYIPRQMLEELRPQGQPHSPTLSTDSDRRTVDDGRRVSPQASRRLLDLGPASQQVRT